MHLGNKEENSHYNMFRGNITQVQVPRKKTDITICYVIIIQVHCSFWFFPGYSVLLCFV